jgi:hypothetical protein
VCPDEFIQACNRLNQPYHVLQTGEKLEIEKRLS